MYQEGYSGFLVETYWKLKVENINMSVSWEG